MVNRALVLLVLLAAVFAHGESLLPENLREAKLVPGSVSPDGKLCLLETFVGETTMNAVVVATMDRKQSLGFVAMRTEYSTAKPYKGRATILWNADGQRVAIHDSLLKHSKVAIYRLTPKGFEQLAAKDPLEAACRHFGITEASVASSGQVPVKWKEGDQLEVRVTLRLKSGKMLSRTTAIHAPLNGPSIPE